LNRFGSLESLRDVVPKLIPGTRRHRPRKSCVLRTPLHCENPFYEPLSHPYDGGTSSRRGAGSARGQEGDGWRRGRGWAAGSHPDATSEGKNTRAEVRWSRGWQCNSAVDGDGGKVDKKCAESGLDRYPGVGHLLDPLLEPTTTPSPSPPSRSPRASCLTSRHRRETALPSWKSSPRLSLRPDLAFSVENILPAGRRGRDRSRVRPWALAEFRSRRGMTHLGKFQRGEFQTGKLIELGKSRLWRGHGRVQGSARRSTRVALRIEPAFREWRITDPFQKLRLKN
jgi:hypothetical protein